MTLRQRDPRQEDAKHLAFVRALPCCVCGSTRNVEAAHVRMGNPAIGKDPTGMAEKPHDKWTVALCRYHHQTGAMAQHRVGEKVFWAMHGRNPFQIAAALWAESGGADRASEREENPKAAKPHKIKARKPSEQRQKIRSNPAMKSRGFGDQHRPMQSRNTFERRT